MKCVSDAGHALDGSDLVTKKVRLHFERASQGLCSWIPGRRCMPLPSPRDEPLISPHDGESDEALNRGTFKRNSRPSVSADAIVAMLATSHADAAHNWSQSPVELMP